MSATPTRAPAQSPAPPPPVIAQAVAYIARLRSYGLTPTVAHLMRRHRDLTRSQAILALTISKG